MIEYLRGTLAHKDPTSVIIDVGGVGFGASISLATYDRLPDTGGEVTLVTHLHVREDLLQIFAFHDEGERRMFRDLMSISGIGARMAMTMLSGCGADMLRVHVAAGDVAAITRIPGIGKKTAERIVVELRDKLQKQVPGAASGMLPAMAQREEALLALQALGYPRATAEKALLRAEASLPPGGITTSTLIRSALPLMSP